MVGSASSATRSTSTATSTATSRRGSWKTSRPTLSSLKRTCSSYSRTWRGEQQETCARQIRPGEIGRIGPRTAAEEGEEVNHSTFDTTTVRRWKRYPGYRAANLDWQSNVPKHWDVKRLKWTVT